MYAARKLRSPEVSNPLIQLIIRDYGQCNRRQDRRRCEIQRRADGAETMSSRAAIPVCRVVGLCLCGCRCGRGLKIFGVDMPKGEDELNCQGKQRGPGTKTAVPSDPMHSRISPALRIICEVNGVNRSRRSGVIPMHPSSLPDSARPLTSGSLPAWRWSGCCPADQRRARSG